MVSFVSVTTEHDLYNQTLFLCTYVFYLLTLLVYIIVIIIIIITITSFSRGSFILSLQLCFVFIVFMLRHCRHVGGR